MRKIAFIFPGQGAQYVGMGKDFYEQFPVSRAIYEKASQITNLDIAKLCFEENEQLNITEFTQIALLTTQVAMLKVVEDMGIKADVNAGLSLGEYAALVSSKVISEEAAFLLVRKRGELMQKAVPTGGAMAAILGLESEIIDQICQSTEGIVSVANYNCPGQIVITGEETAVIKACETLKEAGARRTIMLNVSGPFHSMMLEAAGEKLGEVLEETEIFPFTTPYVTNVIADYVTEPAFVKTLLKQQIYSSVKWQQSMERLIADGVNTFIEIGPGKTLSGFMKKINKEVMILNIEKVEDLHNVVSSLQE